MGIHCKGGFRAGKYFAEVGMGGLGRLSFAMIPLKNYTVPGLRVFTENPGVCEMASYVAATRVPWGVTSKKDTPLTILPPAWTTDKLLSWTEPVIKRPFA